MLLICQNAMMRVEHGLAHVTFMFKNIKHIWWPCSGSPLVRDGSLGAPAFLKIPYCGLRMNRKCRERFPRPPRVSDPDMHHGTCVTHVPWCMSGSLTSGFLSSRWWGKRSRHSRRMRNPQFYVSGKRPMEDQAKVVVDFWMRIWTIWVHKLLNFQRFIKKRIFRWMTEISRVEFQRYATLWNSI